MSDDLISRSAVIKEISEYLKSAYDCDGIEDVSDFQRGNESKQSYIVEGLYEAFELIGNMPTAYDVDKVAERLEELKKSEQLRAAEYDEAGRLDMMDIHDAKAEAYRNSRRIVKSGGIE